MEFYQAACSMRGHVPEWDDSYIKRFVPQHIIDKMLLYDYWVDDGFWWGFQYVFATKIKATLEPVVAVATKPLGQGIHIVKIIDTNGVLTEYEGSLIL